MSRIRSTKPEFWTDEKVGECSPTARLLLLGSLNFADDHGGLDRSAKQLKAQVFPYDNFDVEPLVQELLKQGLFVEYESCGKKYLHIKGFLKHQRVEKPSKPRVPVYDESLKTPGVVGEDSPSSYGSSLGVESKGVEGITKSAAAPLVLHESLPTEDWEQWLAHRRKRKWPCDSVTLRKQLAVLTEYDTPTQREIISQSINAGWQGIFRPKGNVNGHAKTRSERNAQVIGDWVKGAT